MKIGIDGGALCVDKNHQFGNYSFTVNLIKAIKKYDLSANKYYLYTFTRPRIRLDLSEKIELRVIKPKYFWSKIGLSVAQITDKNDIFLAINQSVPLVRPKKIIGFSHGLAFYFYKELYPNSWKKMFKQHQIMLKQCDYLVVSSIKVKKELLKIFPNYEKKINVLLYGVPLDLKMSKQFERIKKSNYFLSVGMNHPIKNFNLLKKIFIQFKEKYSQFSYHLKIINSGYNASALSNLYQKARVFLSTSRYESFNFPVLEALASGCPVVAFPSAIIPEMREFVFLAKGENDFSRLLNNVINQKVRIKSDKLKAIFSWKKYINQLLNLYD